MASNTIHNSDNKTKDAYIFTVKRITELQSLLSCVEKKQINLFINEVRQTVTSYHKSQLVTLNDQEIKQYERFFIRLDDKAHQLARFTTELSTLVNQAPKQLYNEAKNADRAIDGIHGKLVDLCITIDKLSKQKNRFYHDAKTTVSDIYNAYCKIFRAQPNCKLFDEQFPLPEAAQIDDLLVPVLEILILKSPSRCYKLLQSVPK